jgi:DNA-binding IclR family transcriptional regulator
MKSLNRGLDVLDAFGERPRRDFNGLAAATGIPRSSLYRLLALLESRGFVRRDPHTGEYSPGVVLYRLDPGAAWLGELRQAARAVMPRLVDAIGESVYLYVREGDTRVCVEALEGTRGTIRHAIKAGSVFPLHAGASGKAILAFLPEPERRALVSRLPLPRLGPNSITSRAQLEEEIERIRRQGYAYGEEELAPGAWAIAVPVPDTTRSGASSLCVAGPMVRLERERLPEYARLLRAAADTISRAV